MLMHNFQPFMMSKNSDDSDEITIIKNVSNKPKPKKKTQKKVLKQIIEIESSEENNALNEFIEIDDVEEDMNKDNKLVEEDMNKDNKLVEEVSNQMIEEPVSNILKEVPTSKYFDSSTVKRIKPNTPPRHKIDLLSATVNIQSIDNNLDTQCKISYTVEELIEGDHNIVTDDIVTEEKVSNDIVTEEKVSNDIVTEEKVSDYDPTKCNNDMTKCNNNQKNEKDCLILLRGSEEDKKFYLKDDSLLEDLFEISGISKVKYRGIPVSKYLSLKEIGYSKDYPYFDIIDDGSSDFNLKINVDFYSTKSIKINKYKKVCDILKLCDKEGMIVMNGIIINEEMKIKDVFENDDVVDVI
jgi:hypothetical protein